MSVLLILSSIGFLVCAIHAKKNHEYVHAAGMFITFIMSETYYLSFSNPHIKTFDVIWSHFFVVFTLIQSFYYRTIIPAICISIGAITYWVFDVCRESDLCHMLFVHIPVFIGSYYLVKASIEFHRLKSFSKNS